MKITQFQLINHTELVSPDWVELVVLDDEGNLWRAPLGSDPEKPIELKFVAVL